MLRTLTFIAVFATGFIIGCVFPGFSAQYQQRLIAQFDQVAVDLQPFRDIADRYHGGSLDALIDYHLASDDPTFHDEGLAIRMMAQSQDRLAETRAAFESSFLEQAFYLYRYGDAEIARATWQSYTPSFIATRGAVLFALSIGLILTVFCYLSLTALRLVGRRSTARSG